MKHDELLAKIDYAIEGNPYDEYTSAIRAVVELHKPIKVRDGLNRCNRCISAVMDDGSYILAQYPCPTIVSIEKELA